MVIDTSALLAILKLEPEAEALIARLSQAGPRRLSTASVLLDSQPKSLSR